MSAAVVDSRPCRSKSEIGIEHMCMVLVKEGSDYSLVHEPGKIGVTEIVPHTDWTAFLATLGFYHYPRDGTSLALRRNYEVLIWQVKPKTER